MLQIYIASQYIPQCNKMQNLQSFRTTPSNFCLFLYKEKAPKQYSTPFSKKNRSLMIGSALSLFLSRITHHSTSLFWTRNTVHSTGGPGPGSFLVLDACTVHSMGGSGPGSVLVLDACTVHSTGGSGPGFVLVLDVCTVHSTRGVRAWVCPEAQLL